MLSLLQSWRAAPRNDHTSTLDIYQATSSLPRHLYSRCAHKPYSLDRLDARTGTWNTHKRERNEARNGRVRLLPALRARVSLWEGASQLYQSLSRMFTTRYCKEVCRVSLCRPATQDYTKSPKKGPSDPAFSKFIFYQTRTPNEVGGNSANHSTR